MKFNKLASLGSLLGYFGVFFFKGFEGSLLDLFISLDIGLLQALFWGRVFA